MKPEQAAKFLQAIGSQPEPYSGGGWVRSHCPLAPWTHANGKDSNPSFGISVHEGKHSHFNCFACESGSVEKLLQLVEFYHGKNPYIGKKYNFDAARALLEQEDLDVFPLGEFTEFPNDEFNHFEEWPEWMADHYPLASEVPAAYAYLRGRKVTDEQIQRHSIRYDAYREMVAFPFRTVYGKLAGMRGRRINDFGPQHYDYSFNGTNNTHNTWLNEPVLEREQIVVIVEGQFDMLTVERVYPYVLGNLTARAMPAKLKKLQGSPGVILMLDNDLTGKSAAQKYITYFEKHQIQYAIPSLPDGIKDPDQAGEDVVRQVLSQFISI
jgi:hypothetical protein